MSKPDILDENSMPEFYGPFYQESPQVEVETELVPDVLLPLLPYAQFWGLDDEEEREDLVTFAPEKVLQNLKVVVALYGDALDDWLAGDVSFNEEPSSAFIAFSAMRLAADAA